MLKIVETEGLNVTETKKKINPVEVIICLFLTAVIVVTGLIGYTHGKKIWIFEVPLPPVHYAANAALLGGQNGIEPGWHYAFAPKAVRDKVKTCPEALEWAAEYYYLWDKVADDDISADVTEGEFPMFVQWDQRWGYRLYGNNYMANNGCGPTALSIVYSGLTGKSDVTPHDLAVYSVNNGLYVPTVGTRWDLMQYGGEFLGLKVDVLNMDWDKARAALEAGKPLICKVGPGDFTTGGHFIVLTAIDEDGMCTVRDPNSKLKSEELWDFDRVMSQTDFAWAYSLK